MKGADRLVVVVADVAPALVPVVAAASGLASVPDPGTPSAGSPTADRIARTAREVTEPIVPLTDPVQWPTLVNGLWGTSTAAADRWAGMVVGDELLGVLIVLVVLVERPAACAATTASAVARARTPELRRCRFAERTGALLSAEPRMAWILASPSWRSVGWGERFSRPSGRA